MSESSTKKDEKDLKRPLTPYFMFLSKIRNEYEEKKMGKPNIKQLNEMWLNISDNEKKLYYNEYEEKKEQYEKAIKSKIKEEINSENHNEKIHKNIFIDEKKDILFNINNLIQDKSEQNEIINNYNNEVNMNINENNNKNNDNNIIYNPFLHHNPINNKQNFEQNNNISNFNKNSKIFKQNEKKEIENPFLSISSNINPFIQKNNNNNNININLLR